MKVIALLFPLLLALPTLSMKWKDEQRKDLEIRLEGTTASEAECLTNGLTVAYRYEFKFCRKRLWWVDACGDEIIEIRTLEYEPISESYFVSVDRLGDEEPPQQFMSLSREEALHDVSHAELKSKPKSTYVQARVRYTCKGDGSPVLDRISNILSLGLVSLGTYQSDWIDFYLE